MNVNEEKEEVEEGRDERSEGTLTIFRVESSGSCFMASVKRRKQLTRKVIERKESIIGRNDDSHRRGEQ